MRLSARTRSGRFTYSILAIACWSTASAAQSEVNLTATVDSRVVRLGESFFYTVMVSGMMDPPAVRLPQMPESFTVHGPSTSKRFEMGTGRGISSTAQFTYTIIPRQAGKFTIGRATLTTNGETYATEPIEIEVVSSGDTGAAQPVPADIFIRAHVDKQEVYVNQPLTLTVSLYRNPNVQLRGNLAYGAPDSEGFFVQSQPEVPMSQQLIGSTRYMVQRVRNIYIPLRSGDLTIDSARIDGSRIVRTRRRRTIDPFFDQSFFGWPFGEAKAFSLQTDPVSIHVRPLPERNQPTSFTGGVGTFDFEVLTPPKKATVGDSITLTARVAGRGYIQGIGPPELPEIADCKLYEPESTLNVETGSGRIGGEKIFTYVLVPQREGLITVPELALSYFDPEREQYVTERNGPFTLQVAAAPFMTPVTIADTGVNGDRGEIRVLGEDIFSIMGHIDLFRQSRPSSPVTAGMVVALPPIAYAALLLGIRRRERLRTDTRYVRRRSALRHARHRLMAADRAGREGDDTTFYQQIHRAVTDYFADKLDRPAAGLTVADVGELLDQLDVNETLVTRATDLLSVCDYGRFGSSGHDRHQQEELLKAAAILLKDFDRELRHSRAYLNEVQ